MPAGFAGAIGAGVKLKPKPKAVGPKTGGSAPVKKPAPVGKKRY